jgi:hypothetical protein
LHPLAQTHFDVGPVPEHTKLNAINVIFNRTAAQDADLQSLIPEKNGDFRLPVTWESLRFLCHSI